MRNSQERGYFEGHLARAHRALFHAQQAAVALSEDGAAEDLEQMLKEVTRIAEGSLRSQPNRRSAAKVRVT